MRVARLDFSGTVGKVVETPQGGIRVPGALTRVGVLRYRDAAGREWAELRPPEEVFAEDSLETLRGAPVTDLHPSAPVTAATFKELSVGHVHDDVRAEGPLVVATLTVQDADEVSRVRSGERRELSCGYSCEPDPTPGVWDGERYDLVQRRIRYNHVGLGPAGWGRAGSDVALRLDGAAIEVPAAPRSDEMKVLKIRGREYKLDAAEEMAAAQGAVDETVKKADADAGELAAVKAALMEALQKVASLEAKMAAASAATPAVTEEMVPEAVADSLVAKRQALVEGARRVLGEAWKADGKKADEIRREVLVKAMPEMKLDGLSVETINGAFLAVTRGAVRNDALGAAHAAATGIPGAAREDSAEAAAAKMRADTANAWKTAKPTFALES